MSSSSYPAAELMKLSEAKTFCIFDHHNCCIRNINPDFDHRRGYKDLDLIFPNASMISSFVPASFSVKTPYFDRLTHDILKHLGIIGYIFCFQRFTLLDHRTDHITLSA